MVCSPGLTFDTLKLPSWLNSAQGLPVQQDLRQRRGPGDHEGSQSGGWSAKVNFASCPF